MVFIDPCYEQRESTYAIIIFGLFVYTRVICYCLFFLFCYIFSELRTVGCSASLRLGSVIFWSLLAMPIFDTARNNDEDLVPGSQRVNGLQYLAIGLCMGTLWSSWLIVSHTWPLDPVWVHNGHHGWLCPILGHWTLYGYIMVILADCVPYLAIGPCMGT